MHVHLCFRFLKMIACGITSLATEDAFKRELKQYCPYRLYRGNWMALLSLQTIPGKVALRLILISSLFLRSSPHLFKVSNGKARTMFEMYSKLTIKKPEVHNWRDSGVCIFNFEQILHIILVFSLLTLNKYIPLGEWLLL